MSHSQSSGQGTSRHAMCTYFDVGYLSRGVVALNRLLAHDPGLELHVLCLDDVTARVLEAESGGRVITLPIAELHEAEPRLLPLRTTRTPWEFIATHKAAFLLHVMKSRGPFEWVSFIDADTASYGSLAAVFAELVGGSIGLSPHRFPASDAQAARYGLYNAGFICFRNDAVGRNCLMAWSEDCINWCHEQPLADGRFMNQGYLTSWPTRYPAVVVMRHPGANLAPWNLSAHRLTFGEHGMLIDGQPLLFFHFSALKRMPDGSWVTQHAASLQAWPEVVRRLYKPYLAEVQAVEHKLLKRHGLSGTGTVRFGDA